MAKRSATTSHQSSGMAAVSASSTPLGEAASITAERRQKMIAEAAYYLAEHRGFLGGDPRQDWLKAEAEIERRLKRAPPPH